MEREGQPFDVQTIADELARLCGLLIERAVDDDTYDLSELWALAKTAMRERWELDRIATLETMLASAISKLDGVVGGISEEEAALRMFNLSGGKKFPNVKKRKAAELLAQKKKPNQKAYGVIYQELRRLTHISAPATLGKKLKELRLRVAENLAELYDPNATAPGRSRQPAPGSRNEQPAAYAILELDPFDLGVHHPIVIDGDVAESVLPSYAERRHDHQLRELLTNITKSLMVVLTGGSSTGKTRTAWEAVEKCLPGWPLHVPHGLDDLDQLRSQRTAQSKDVVWLDEAQDILQADPTAIPRTLRALLAAPGRVVVLATMRTDPYWLRFTTEPVRGEPDPWRQMRALLLDSRRVVRIRVPESFADEPQALDTLRRLARTDSRLAEALSTASDGKVIQTLSGGTLLVNRYQDAADTRRHAWAVITAAIDACRLGHARRLPAGVLENGALGYLSEETDRVGDDDWFTAALRHATQEVRGVAIFRPARVSGGVGSADSYILDDYVLQHGQQVRKYVPAPASLWDALIVHVGDPSSRKQLVEAAEDRHLLEVAISLAGPAAEESRLWFLYKLIELIERTGMGVEDLNAAKQELGILADPVAMRERAIARQEAGSIEEANEWWELAALAGDVRAMTVLAKRDEALGEIDSAAGYLLQRADCLPIYDLETGPDRRRSPIWDVVTLFCRAGRLEEAEEFWRMVILIDNSMLDLLDPDGDGQADADVPYEKEWLSRAIAEFEFPLHKIAWSFDPRAEAILRRIAEDDNPASPFAMEELADLLKRNERTDDAAAWLRRAAEAGNPSAMRRQAQNLDADDQAQEADDWWRRAAQAGDEEAIWHEIQHHEAAGTGQEVDGLWQWVLQGDDSEWHVDSIYRFVGRLAESGQTDRAESLARYAADTRGPHAWTCLAEYLVDHGQHEEAEVWLRRAVVLGERPAYDALRSLLRRRKPEESERLMRFGVEPDGKTAEPGE